VPLGAAWGASACLVAAVVGFALQATVILRSPAVRLREQPGLAAA
jgi:hypothetical protein